MSRRKREDIFVSVVAPVTDDESLAGKFAVDVSDLLKDRYANYELILVDNGSTDGTIDQIKELLDHVSCIRVIRLSRNYDLETAIFAGLEASIGDYVTVLLPGVDPPALIPMLIDHLIEGTDIVIGNAAEGTRIDSLLSRPGRRAFYWYSKRFLRIDIPSTATYLIGLNRRAVNALVKTQGRYRHVRQLSQQVGFATARLNYEPYPKASKKRGFFSEVNRAMEIAVSYSRHPLRLVSWLGLVAGFLNLGYGVYALYIYFFTDDAVKGWTTLSLVLTVMFFLIFVILVVLSEYVGRILEETRQQPAYYVMEELTSRETIADIDRRNVSS
jgi:polyisoprenyl-phosphate glycosyltransferase